MATAVVTAIATQGVRRWGSTRPSGRGRMPCSAMPNTRRLAMIIVSRAPLATATRATALKRVSGIPASAARTTSRSGPGESASSAGSRTTEAASPTSTYTAPATSRAPNSARGYTRRTSRTSSAMVAEVSKPTKE